MLGLIDFDSILYKAVYRVVSFGRIRWAINEFGKEGARQWLLEEVYNEGINRTENVLLDIQNHLQDIFFEEITSWELYLTTCSKNFRKEVDAEYKANRKKNNYVWLLREHYRNNGAFCSETLEADDLIANRCKDLGIGERIIISLDKDLKQLGGYYWSYYKQKSKDFDGNLVLNEFGEPETEYKQRNVDFITKDEADYLFWYQVLTGDAGDNIKGLHGIGPAKANKILDQSKNRFITVAREYMKREMKQELRDTVRLVRLGY